MIGKRWYYLARMGLVALALSFYITHSVYVLDPMIADASQGSSPSLPLWRSLMPPLMLALGFALAAHAQQVIDRRENLSWSYAVYMVGAVLFAWQARHRQLERTARDAIPFEIRKSYLGWALLFAVLAFVGFGGNRMSLRGIFPWVVAMLFCFLALPKGRSVDQGQSTPRRTRWQHLVTGDWAISWTTCSLILALLLGVFLRLYRLAEHPADLGWDAPYNYTDGQRVLRGEHLIFFPDNYGREGMFFYLIAAVAQFIPLSPYSIRITSAMAGLVTIPALYLLARECCDRETATLAALVLAVNKWHIVLTRSGFRVSLMPLFVVLTLYGLARALRRGQPRDWAWCGLFMGLGLWTYKAFLFSLPIVMGIALVYLLWSRGRQRLGMPSAIGEAATQWPAASPHILMGLLMMLLVTVAVAMPMVRFLYDAPKVYLARELLGIRLVKEDLQRSNMTTVQLLLRNLPVSLGMFHYRGDPNSRFGVPFQRHMGFWSGVLLFLGLAYSLARLRRGGNALLVLSLLGYLVPMIVTMRSDELPNCFRSAGVIGPGLILAAMALKVLRIELAGMLQGLVERLSAVLAMRRGAFKSSGGPCVRTLAALPALVLVGALLYGEARETYHFYFVDFLQHTPDQANYSIALEIAKIITAFEDGPAYVRLWPHWYDDRGLLVHLDVLGGRLAGGVTDLRPDAPPLQGFRGKMLVLLHPQDTASLAVLKEFFPRAIVNEHRFPNGDLAIVAFYGER